MTTKQVWKFPVEMIDEFAVDMPRGAHVLTVQVQYGRTMMWALVDPTEPPQKRRFRLAGTGHSIEHAERVMHIGTFQTHGGDFVWHLFERVKGG